MRFSELIFSDAPKIVAPPPMSVALGRVRKDETLGLTYVVVDHNMIRGGAGRAVLMSI